MRVVNGSEKTEYDITLASANVLIESFHLRTGLTFETTNALEVSLRNFSNLSETMFLKRI